MDISHSRIKYYKTASLTNTDVIYSIKKQKKTLKNLLQTIEIQKQVLGEEHPDYATSLDKIGTIYSEMSDYKTALKYQQQSMEIRKKVLGEEHPDYATSLYHIGLEYYYTEDYQNALKYNMQAMDIRKKILGEEHPDYATSLDNIGTIYSELGDYQNAMKYHMQSMEIRKKVLGENHPDYAISLNNIGAVYSNTGDYQTALKYCLKALEIEEKTIGKKNLQYAITINNIGTLHFIAGDESKYSNYVWEATKIRRKVLGNKHPEYARSLHDIGSSAIFMEIKTDDDGPFDIEFMRRTAMLYLRHALKIRKEIFGEENLEYAISLKNSGTLYFYLKEYETATKMNNLTTDIFKRKLIRNFSFMTAHEREKYWEISQTYLDNNILYAYLLPDYPLTAKTAYDTELITKGLLLASEISMTNVIMESGNSALIAEYEKMKKLQLQLNDELEKTISERASNCDSLDNEIQKLERHIIEGCKEFGDITHFIKIDWKEVQNSLKDNDVAIEFSNFAENDTTRYVALVLTKEMEHPVCVPLFDESKMQKLIRGYSPQKADSVSDNDDRGAKTVSKKWQKIYESTELYEMIWKPLEKYFPESPRIYFAPSGILHRTAIEYASIGNSQTISDKYEIYRVSSTRFLAMDYMPKPMENSVLYGGIHYDSDTTIMKHESERFAMRGNSEPYMSFAELNKDEDRSSLPYLPGTKTEVENIFEKMTEKNISAVLYEGAQANEESFKSLSGKDISTLHIATHGFFLSSERKMSGDYSLIQSGLLLSGANYAWQNKPIPAGIEDGILTAKEISFMDLRKTDLVVLSACQTALGEITGEGVFGLQRGFKKAGARTIIMSLWPVDDDATQLMMTEFYTNLTNGMTKREAFLAAQNKVKTTAGFENPRYWAAFIMLDGND